MKSTSELKPKLPIENETNFQTVNYDDNQGELSGELANIKENQRSRQNASGIPLSTERVRA